MIIMNDNEKEKEKKKFFFIMKIRTRDGLGENEEEEEKGSFEERLIDRSIVRLIVFDRWKRKCLKKKKNSFFFFFWKLFRHGIFCCVQIPNLD